MSKRIYPLTMYYDGACSICVREVNRLTERDRIGRLNFVDIAELDDADWPFDIGRDEMMQRIHARDGAGRWLVGVEVMRATREAIGQGWRYAWTDWPMFKPICDAAYLRFARNRYRLSRWFGCGNCAEGRCGVTK